MTLDEFKRIYYLEHFHRVYGRVLGLFIVLPTTYFVVKKGLAVRHKLSLVAASFLVCAQVCRLISHQIRDFSDGTWSRVD